MTEPGENAPLEAHVDSDLTNTAGTARTVRISYTRQGEPIDLRLQIRVTGMPSLVSDLLGAQVEDIKRRCGATTD
jgi:hypothetical protein